LLKYESEKREFISYLIVNMIPLMKSLDQGDLDDMLAYITKHAKDIDTDSLKSKVYETYLKTKLSKDIIEGIMSGADVMPVAKKYAYELGKD